MFPSRLLLLLYTVLALTSSAATGAQDADEPMHSSAQSPAERRPKKFIRNKIEEENHKFVQGHGDDDGQSSIVILQPLERFLMPPACREYDDDDAPRVIPDSFMTAGCLKDDAELDPPQKPCEFVTSGDAKTSSSDFSSADQFIFAIYETEGEGSGGLTMFIGPDHPAGDNDNEVLHHSSLALGKRVSAAGFIKVNSDDCDDDCYTLKGLSTQTGHYFPRGDSAALARFNQQVVVQALTMLNDLGYNGLQLCKEGEGGMPSLLATGFEEGRAPADIDWKGHPLTPMTCEQLFKEQDDMFTPAECWEVMDLDNALDYAYKEPDWEENPFNNLNLQEGLPKESDFKSGVAVETPAIVKSAAAKAKAAAAAAEHTALSRSADAAVFAQHAALKTAAQALVDTEKAAGKMPAEVATDAAGAVQAAGGSEMDMAVAVEAGLTDNTRPTLRGKSSPKGGPRKAR